MAKMRVLVLTIVTGLLLLRAQPASADATAFVGANTTPSNRLVRGFAVGVGFLIVGFEFEYAFTSEDTSTATRSPSLKTGMGNVLVQTPTAIFGFQPYATAGIGVYREQLDAHEDTDLGTNIGGGAKINLLGPIRLRLDYRVFNLGNGALNSPAHRVYAGLNLAF